EFPRGLRLLPAASGILATGPRLLQKASWRRPKKAADFPIGARPLRGVRGSARSRASLAVQAFWVQVYSQNRPLFIDRKSTRLNSSHQIISYAVFCLKK